MSLANARANIELVIDRLENLHRSPPAVGDEELSSDFGFMISALNAAVAELKETDEEIEKAIKKLRMMRERVRRTG